MDSKQPLAPSYDDANEPAPPSYTETISASTYYSTQIRSQLSTISTTISTLESQKSLLSSARDEKILSLLTTQIQIFLSDFANSGLKKGTLILVPANGLTDDNAIPTDYDFKDKDEYDRVVRVRSKDEPAYDEWSSEPQETWFWRDEDMARRLARYLKPPPPTPRMRELPPRVVPSPRSPQAEGSSSRSFWGRKKSTPKVVPTLPVHERKDSKLEFGTQQAIMNSADSGDDVSMEVNAEEVVFRTEDEMGLFGTERGYGIVLRLKVVFGSDTGR